MFLGCLFAQDNVAKYKVKGMQCSQSCPVRITQKINETNINNLYVFGMSIRSR